MGKLLQFSRSFLLVGKFLEVMSEISDTSCASEISWMSVIEWPRSFCSEDEWVMPKGSAKGAGQAFGVDEWGLG